MLGSIRTRWVCSERALVFFNNPKTKKQDSQDKVRESGCKGCRMYCAQLTTEKDFVKHHDRKNVSSKRQEGAQAVIEFVLLAVTARRSFCLKFGRIADRIYPAYITLIGGTTPDIVQMVP